MAIMMLDHTREFVHRDAFFFDAANVARTYPVLFFTRWITHFCAPLFVFLAGTAASFQEMRGLSKGKLSRFLISRGLWLIAIEIFVLRVLILFNFHYAGLFAFLQVIWAIGCSLIALAAVVHLPLRTIIVLSVAVIALHNTLDSVRVATFNGPGTPVPGFAASVWHVLHQPGVIFPFGSTGPPVLVIYPLIPWVAVMCAGYACGALYRKDEMTRRRVLLLLGSALVLAFVVIRGLNVYGDPVRWSVQGSPAKTVLSFLAATKYPPSLIFLLMTLGPGLLFLACAERHTRGRLAQILITYGRVPFFFYVLQWLMAHSLAIIVSLIAGKPTAHLFSNIGFDPLPPAGTGFGLLTVYALWLLGLILLYPLCRWFSGVKARRREWWLSYV
jgi:uncharacterized membrane protein